MAKKQKGAGAQGVEAVIESTRPMMHSVALQVRDGVVRVLDEELAKVFGQHGGSSEEAPFQAAAVEPRQGSQEPSSGKVLCSKGDGKEATRNLKQPGKELCQAHYQKELRDAKKQEELEAAKRAAGKTGGKRKAGRGRKQAAASAKSK